MKTQRTLALAAALGAILGVSLVPVRAQQTRSAEAYVAIATTHHVCTNQKPLNVRDKPSLNQSTVVGQLPKHTNVEVIQEASNPDWSLVNLEDGTGYVASKWLCSGPAPGPIVVEPTNPNDRRVCTKSSPLSVRSVPRLDGQKVGSLSKDSLVTIGGYTLDNAWTWVETDNATGWASSDYLCPLEDTEA